MGGGGGGGGGGKQFLNESEIDLKVGREREWNGWEEIFFQIILRERCI